jgi:hypothetical protein
MKTFSLPLLLFITILCFACGGDKKEVKEVASTAPPANMQEAMQQAEKAVKDAQMQQVEPVNFRTLQELLPEKTAGFERTKMGGQTAGAMGIKFSKAEGKYKNADGKNLQLDIMDTGGLGMGTMSMAAWAMVDVDKEDDNGYERTGTLNGYKSYEKFRKSGSDSELGVLVEKRFVVTANCRGCDMETMRSVIQSLDLGKLKNL